MDAQASTRESSAAASPPGAGTRAGVSCATVGGVVVKARSPSEWRLPEPEPDVGARLLLPHHHHHHRQRSYAPLDDELWDEGTPARPPQPFCAQPR
jgi:hypothetical protein